MEKEVQQGTSYIKPKGTNNTREKMEKKTTRVVMEWKP